MFDILKAHLGNIRDVSSSFCLIAKDLFLCSMVSFNVLSPSCLFVHKYDKKDTLFRFCLRVIAVLAVT